MAYCRIYLFAVALCISSGIIEGQKSKGYDPEADDLMFGDAQPVPTPAVCSEGTTCGFLQYDDDFTGNHNHTFTHYCNCPDGMTCVREGTNMELRYYYFKCHNVTQPQSSDIVSPVPTENGGERSSSTQPSESSDTSSQSSAPNQKRFGYVSEEL